MTAPSTAAPMIRVQGLDAGLDDQVVALLEERGWKGLTRFERVAADNHKP